MGTIIDLHRMLFEFDKADLMRNGLRRASKVDHACLGTSDHQSPPTARGDDD
jgi:hypothetical protein